MNMPAQKHSAFKQRVFSVVKKITKGLTMTYAEVARAIGNPKSARAVGNALKTNFDPSIPCHRVIHSDGTLGKYNRGKRAKRKILRAERLSALNHSGKAEYGHLTAKKRKKYTV